MAERRRADAWIWALAAITAAGAALRFSTLSVQSFWLDEAVTHQLVTRPFGAMLSAIPHSESTPPLYYVLAWAWVHVFSAGEVGLRSLSALIGTSTIVLLALIARRLGGWRAGLAAAALCATNPLLIWYSQEARAYALLVALCALSLWCLLREDWRGFALASGLALATHYFAVFIVVPELAWLCRRHVRRSRTAAWSAIFVVAVAAALAPLAVVQASGNRASFIHASGLAGRIVALPKQFLIGYATPHQAVVTAVAAVLAVALAFTLRRADRGLLALAAFAVGVPVAMAVVGLDYLITRNLIAAMVPLVALAGVAATRSRAGPALVGALCAVGVIAYAGVEADPYYQRDDWRAAAAALGPATHGARVIVVNPSDGVPALNLYLPVTRPPTGRPETMREIDVIDLAHDPPPVGTPFSVEGFTLCAPPVQTREYDIVRYCASTPVTEPFLVLERTRLPLPEAAILLNG
ncbi:MAG: glycosyltransferase family 39 protein [Solirubrobacteraceae bacterium]